MRLTCTFISAILTMILFTSSLLAQATVPVTSDDPKIAISTLREELIGSFNKGDLPRLLSHLDPDVVVTWQNSEVCRGPNEVKAYYDKMMTGSERRVKSVHADPKITDRHLYNDWAVSWGTMNDEFILADGTQLKLDSKFTATIARRGSEWKVTSFHVSGNLFENPIVGYAVKRTALMSAAIAGVIGLAIGFIAARFLKNRKTAQI